MKEGGRFRTEYIGICSRSPRILASISEEVLLSSFTVKVHLLLKYDSRYEQDRELPLSDV